jgi:hypothetical protein
MLGWVIERADADSTEVLLASLKDPDKRVRLKVLDALRERRAAGAGSTPACPREGRPSVGRQQDAVSRAGQVGDATTVAQLRPGRTAKSA